MYLPYLLSELDLRCQPRPDLVGHVQDQIQGGPEKPLQQLVKNNVACA